LIILRANLPGGGFVAYKMLRVRLPGMSFHECCMGGA
jgi:hypothetical protein